MLDWVKRSFQLYAVRHAKVDMRRQIDVYAGMDDSEVAFLDRPSGERGEPGEPDDRD